MAALRGSAAAAPVVVIPLVPSGSIAARSGRSLGRSGRVIPLFPGGLHCGDQWTIMAQAVGDVIPLFPSGLHCGIYTPQKVDQIVNVIRSSRAGSIAARSSTAGMVWSRPHPALPGRAPLRHDRRAIGVEQPDGHPALPERAPLRLDQLPGAGDELDGSSRSSRAGSIAASCPPPTAGPRSRSSRSSRAGSIAAPRNSTREPRRWCRSSRSSRVGSIAARLCPSAAARAWNQKVATTPPVSRPSDSACRDSRSSPIGVTCPRPIRVTPG